MTKLLVNEIIETGTPTAASTSGVEIEVGATDKTVLLLSATGGETITVKAGNTVLGGTADLVLTAPAGSSVLNVDGKFAAGNKITVLGPSSVKVTAIVLP